MHPLPRATLEEITDALVAETATDTTPLRPSSGALIELEEKRTAKGASNRCCCSGLCSSSENGQCA